jgi:hypothetical protein
MSNWAGRKLMQKMARADMRDKLRELEGTPRGTHLGAATPDSIDYVAEIQRILAEVNERR